MSHVQAQNLRLRARPVTWGKSLEVCSAHNTWAGAVCVECAAIGSRTQCVLLRTEVGVAVPFTCKQCWLDVQTARTPKR
jgi:hypothetical protein